MQPSVKQEVTTPDREQTEFVRLIETIDAIARSGRVDPLHGAYNVLGALQNCNEFHWAAYAKAAKIRQPTEAVIAAAMGVYAERVRNYKQK